MKRFVSGLLLIVVAAAAQAEQRFGFVAAERVEYREAADEILWDISASYGSDLHKLVVKTEGELEGSDVEEAELQLLYGRAWTAFFDLQFGVRYDDFDGASLASVVAGVQGDARYGFEVDAAAFISEDGDVTLRAELEKDFLLTEQWILQPRIELTAAFQDVPELRVSSGIASIDAGLRLRYEITRKLAPYLGISHERRFGDFKDDDTTAVAGLRFWF